MTWIPFADGDRSCPPGTSGSWCSADPARTRVTSLEGASGRPIHARYFADGPCSATPSTDRCCPWGTTKDRGYGHAESTAGGDHAGGPRRRWSQAELEGEARPR